MKGDNCQRININLAAEILGISAPAVRERMRRGLLPIGYAISPAKKGGKWSFYIYKDKLNQFIGRNPEESLDTVILREMANR